MVFHWRLSDSKSTQVFRTLLSILAVLNRRGSFPTKVIESQPLMFVTNNFHSLTHRRGPEDREVMAINGSSIIPRAPELEPHHQIQFQKIKSDYSQPRQESLDEEKEKAFNREKEGERGMCVCVCVVEGFRTLLIA